MPRVLFMLAVACCVGCSGEAGVQRALRRATGVVQLPVGVIELSSELKIPEGAHDLEIVGAVAGTILRATADFRGRAILSCRSARRVRLRNFTVNGGRPVLEKAVGLPPAAVPFAGFYDNNGLLAEDVESLTVENVRFVNIANFALLVSRSRNVRIKDVLVDNCGSRNPKGRNNSTGGILLEEGTADFQVLGSVFRNVRGNAVWTHSLYDSPRNRDGLIARNSFREIARDAIQVGHAANVRVEDNTGRRIGYPVDDVDVENGATPVAIDTAGNVDKSVYARNRFEEINGKCIDLDGFHDGAVIGNTCVNRQPAEAYPFGHYGIVMNNSNPDMQSANITIEGNVIDGTKFGGIFVIGTGHRILGNQLRNLNLAGCNESAARFGCSYFPGEPDLLQSGIYLGRRAERPAIAANNIIEDNIISGHGMKTRCIGLAPGVSRTANRIHGNQCGNGADR